jgi:hypothetical protein
MRRTSPGARAKCPGAGETGSAQGNQMAAVLPRRSGPSPRTGSPGRRQSRPLIPGSRPPCGTNCSESWRALSHTLTTADSGLVEAAFASTLAGLGDGEFTETARPAPSGLTTNDGAAQAPANPHAVAQQSPAATAAQPDGNESSSLVTTRRKRRGRPPAAEASVPEATAGPPVPEEPVNNAVAWHIDKSALALSEPRRYRDRAHLEFVSAQPCLLCGRQPSDAHHLRFAQPRALGRRVSDEFTVPLCRTHHRFLHSRGDEEAWWKAVKFDPVIVARRLWDYTRLKGAPGHRRLATPLADATAPAAGDTEDGTVDQNVDGAKSNPKEPSAGPESQ